LSRLFGLLGLKKVFTRESGACPVTHGRVRNTGPHLRMSTGSAWYVQD
jgi:hypothetical protein